MNQAFVYDAVRTPFGKFGSGLAGVRPDDLAAHVIRESVKRAPGLDPERIDEVVFGNANGAGEENRNIARMGTLLAGLPVSIPGTHGEPVVRFLAGCGDHRLAADQCRRRRADAGGWGGVDVPGPVGAAEDGEALPGRGHDPGLHHAGLAPGEQGHAEGMDHLPGRGHRTVAGEVRGDPGAAGRVRRRTRTTSPPRRGTRVSTTTWSAPVPGTDLVRDEGIRAGSSAEKLAGLKTVFRAENGTVTAGNASPLSDGASAAWIGIENAAGLLGLEPLARIAGRGAHGNDPQFFGYAPVEAANKALAKAGIGWDQVGAVELNEAFAAQSLACINAWGIDPGIVNRHGGAIAMGHPLGASGHPDPGHPRPVPAGLRGTLGRRGDLHRRGPGPRRRPRKRTLLRRQNQ